MQTYHIHPKNPQSRLIDKAAAALATGAIITCPTDTGYRLIAQLSVKAVHKKLKAITQQDNTLAWPILFVNLSQLAQYATLSNAQHRIIKANTAQSIAFILPATKSIPTAFLSKNKTICVEFAQGAIIQALIHAVGEPIVSCPLYDMNHCDMNDALTDPYLIAQTIHTDGIIDVGTINHHISTVLDIQADSVSIIRQGDNAFDDTLWVLDSTAQKSQNKGQAS